MRPQDTTTIADVVLPAPPGASTRTRARTSSRRLRVNEKFYSDRPGEVESEYLIFARLARKLAAYATDSSTRTSGSTSRGRTSSTRCVRPRRARRSALDLITTEAAAGAGHQRHPAADQAPRWRLVGTERIYDEDFATEDRRRRFPSPPATRSGTATPIRWCSCPSRLKPNAEFPFFVTTVALPDDLAVGLHVPLPQRAPASHSQSFMEFVVHPDDAYDGRADRRRLGRAQQPVLALRGRGQRLRRGAARPDLRDLRLGGPQTTPQPACPSTTPTTSSRWPAPAEVQRRVLQEHPWRAAQDRPPTRHRGQHTLGFSLKDRYGRVTGRGRRQPRVEGQELRLPAGAAPG